MWKLMRLRLILVVIALSLLLASCRSQLYKIFQDSPCEPPCWYDLSPGETTMENSLNKLDSLDFVNKYNQYNQENTYIRGEIGRIHRFVIWFKDDKLSGFRFTGKPASETTLRIREAIVLFGEPEKLYIHRFSFREGTAYLINLLYSDKGLMLSTIDGGLQGYIDIKPNDRVYEIDFFNPDQYYEYVSSNILPFDKFDPVRLIPWSGYQRIYLPLP